MARSSSSKRSILPKLNGSRLKRPNEHSSLTGTTDLEYAATQETESARRISHDETNLSSPEPSSHDTPLDVLNSKLEFIMDPIFLGEDFAALLQIPSIPTQENLWIDLWQQFGVGEKIVPVDDQYLTSLKSFVGLRCLRVTGMLKSYQKQLFQAIWKMEKLEYLQLRMAEEPRLASGVSWRRIEKGWLPKSQDLYSDISPGTGKGRIKRKYGNGEYFDNCVIELAKPRLSQDHPDFESWMSRLLPIAHLSLRGFVVDAIPFCSCFDGQRLRSITFIDCYDAGFYLPDEMVMHNVEILVDEIDIAKSTPIRQLSPDRDLKRITLKAGKKVEEYPAYSQTWDRSASNTQSKSVSIPRSAVASSSSRSSSHGGKIPKFGWSFRKHAVKTVIEEDEGGD